MSAGARARALVLHPSLDNERAHAVLPGARGHVL